uniref:SFRICE_032036 n=1 Tax=Spodoptera frugiperda TaxID=7108 RepID=A0A2H1VB31_SPOFR
MGEVGKRFAITEVQFIVLQSFKNTVIRKLTPLSHGGLKVSLSTLERAGKVTADNIDTVRGMRTHTLHVVKTRLGKVIGSADYYEYADLMSDFCIELIARHPKLPPKSVDDVMTAEINKWIRCARAA